MSQRGLAVLSLGFVALVILTWVTGCTPEKKASVRLQGTVTVAGKPIPPNVESGITFGPLDITQGNPAYSKITDGKFDVPNAPKGKVLVTFSLQKPTKEEAFAPGARPQMQYESLVPPSAEKGIEIQVDDDKSDLVFDLK